MLARDRLFLEEYAEYGYLTHIAIAVALFEASVGSRFSSRALVGAVERVFDEVQRGGPPSKLGQAGERRLRGIGIARLFAEQMAAIEDVGALAWSVQHRNRSGIFKRYLESRTSDVGNLFHQVANCENEAAVLAMLKLPALPELRELIPKDVFALAKMDQRYEGYGVALKKMAGLYRSTVDKLEAPVTSLAGAGEKVHVVIDVGSAEQVPAPSRPDIYVHTYNRIKHRFAIVESPEAFDHIPDQEKPVFCSSLSPTAEDLKVQLLNIGAVSTVGCDLAQFLLLLDDNGYAL